MDEIRNLEKFYLEDIRNIITENYTYFQIKRMTLALSTYQEDTEEGFDVVLDGRVRIAVRIRKKYYFDRFRDFTIRSRSRTGALTELGKLIAGYGELYIYAWEDIHRSKIENWMIIDIDNFRDMLMFPDKGKDIPNIGKDGNPDGTRFNGYSIEMLNRYNAILAKNFK